MCIRILYTHILYILHVSPALFSSHRKLGLPDTPVVTTLQANTTSFFLSWEEPAVNNAPILMYQITLQVVGDESGNTSVFTSATTELTVTGLTPFTVYSVQVVAVNSIGSSPPSPLRTVMTADGSEPTICIIHFMHSVYEQQQNYYYIAACV